MNSKVTTPDPGNRFAGELRRWRGVRRLSQLELAIRADTTQRHLSYMEQGRSRPGRTMVVRLAESLGLSPRERNAMLHAAGYAPLFPESSLDDAALRPAIRALEQILIGHLPCPAIVTGPRGRMVAANAAITVLTEGVSAELLRPPVNVLRLALHPDGVAARVLNLAEWGQHILQNLRDHAARGPDPALDDLLAELRDYLPPPRPGPEHLGFAVPLRLRGADGELRLITTLTSFATAVDVTLAELHLEAFLPADEDTAAILAARATTPDEEALAALPPGLLVRREHDVAGP
ncbi:helix-turn-helix domain-containing protein [Pseudonocardia spinosispora]|uniref:helix-turn-helix domain-containing protein n=1 Tax=Pseudonocardia spinosispora TaxID=103441 RepID=UPI00068766D7|nr:helix-turn-helix transcriptional regulator [Pseudonocardia spinosispora]